MRQLLWRICLAFVVAGSAAAQDADYPSRPVTIIIPQASGGPTDAEVRIYATKLGGLLGQSFVIDFKPGAGGSIGNAFVAKSRPDGYTLLVVTSNFTVIPALYKNLPFDIVKDFAPVSQMSQKSLVIVSRTAFVAKNLVEYLAYARANPEKINYGTTGAGATAHLIGAWLHNASNTKVTYIPYKGAGPMQIDLLSGRVDVTATSLSSALPLMKAGKLRALAVTDDKRMPVVPDVPTVAEQGVPGYRYVTWMGMMAPAATHSAVVGKVSEGLSRVIKMPDVIATLDAQGSVGVGSTQAQFKQLISTEIVRWQKLVQEVGIKLEGE